MSLPLRQVAQRIGVPAAAAAAMPSSLLQTSSKSRLFRINRNALSPSFFLSREGEMVGACKYFTLISRRLSDQVLDNVNRGPPWLSAPYPPGILHARHEKLRLINHVEINTFRTGKESEQDHLEWEQEMKNLKMMRLPLLERDNQQNNKIPTLVITSKKKVHKSAVVRFKVARKLWRAFDMAIQKVEGSSSQLPRGEFHLLHKFIVVTFVYKRFFFQFVSDSATLYLFAATKEAHDATLDDVTSEVLNILNRHASKRARKGNGNDGFQRQGKAILNQKKYQR